MVVSVAVLAADVKCGSLSTWDATADPMAINQLEQSTTVSRAPTKKMDTEMMQPPQTTWAATTTGCELTVPCPLCMTTPATKESYPPIDRNRGWMATKMTTKYEKLHFIK
jgi:hypothetical protein